MSSSNLDAASLISLYRRMRLIRRFEERTAELIDAGEIRAHAHLYIGEEAVAVGVSAALETSDVTTSTHRGHGHILAKGGDPMRMFAELMGRETGYNKGRGGSMHIADVGLGIFGANGIVGAGAPMACGAARMFKNRGEPHVAVPFFGDGAMNQGDRSADIRGCDDRHRHGRCACRRPPGHPLSGILADFPRLRSTRRPGGETAANAGWASACGSDLSDHGSRSQRRPRRAAF